MKNLTLALMLTALTLSFGCANKTPSREVMSKKLNLELATKTSIKFAKDCSFSLGLYGDKALSKMPCRRFVHYTNQNDLVKMCDDYKQASAVDSLSKKDGLFEYGNENSFDTLVDISNMCSKSGHEVGFVLKIREAVRAFQSIGK